MYYKTTQTKEDTVRNRVRDDLKIRRQKKRRGGRRNNPGGRFRGGKRAEASRGEKEWKSGRSCT